MRIDREWRESHHSDGHSCARTARPAAFGAVCAKECSDCERGNAWQQGHRALVPRSPDGDGTPGSGAENPSRVRHIGADGRHERTARAVADAAPKTAALRPWRRSPVSPAGRIDAEKYTDLY